MPLLDHSCDKDKCDKRRGLAGQWRTLKKEILKEDFEEDTEGGS